MLAVRVEALVRSVRASEHISRCAGHTMRRSAGRHPLHRFPQCNSLSYHTRKFSSTIPWQKGKKGKHRDDEHPPQSEILNKKGTPPAAASDQSLTDILKLSSLKAEISRIHDKLKKDLGMLKPGGRFNPSLIEALRVDLSKLQAHEPNNSEQSKHAKEAAPAYVKNNAETHEAADKVRKGSKKQAPPQRAPVPTVALSELAQVIPRGGKQVLIMLNEEAFAKPVSSAILSSPYSLNPQPSATNPLELTVPIPSPSQETRQHTLSQVDKLKERAEFDLREGRGDMHKTLRAMNLNGSLRPDDHHKGQKDMEKVVEEAKTEIKRLCDASRKALQQG